MTLTTSEIETVVGDLGPRIEGGRIERIDQPEPEKLILSIRNGPELYWLLICTHPRFSRLHFLTMRPEKSKPARGFCNVVRRHLTSAPIEAVRQAPADRVVTIDAVARGPLMEARPFRLVAELKGVGSNLLLVDDTGKVIAALSRETSGTRSVAPGLQYVAPAAPEALPPKALTNRFQGCASADDPLALSRAIQTEYAKLEGAEEIVLARSALRKALTRALKRGRARLRKLNEALLDADEAEAVRRRAELLQLVLHDVARGTEQITMTDVFDPEQPEVTIELDPRVPPRENVERLFRRYKKAKAGRERLREQAAGAKAGVGRLEGMLEETDSAGSAEELAAVEERARQAGVRIDREQPKPSKREAPPGPRSFVSGDGLEILVSRSSRENDRLTFSIARGNDYWMHLSDWPGPHVVVRSPRGEDVPNETLLDAAHLAVHFSKIRGARSAEVIYTQCKNVRRARGASPGRVNYANARHLQVRIEEQRLARLMARGRTGPDDGG